MEFVINIPEDSAAAKVFQAFMDEKMEFRKAVEAGKIEEYAERNPEEFATPV